MTGRAPMRLGVAYSVIRPWSMYGVPVSEHFMPETFKAAGYQTAICGKWHLGHAYAKYLPHRRGFDHAYGHVNGAIDYHTHIREGGLDWHRNGKSVREEGYSTDLIAAEAVRWLKGHDRAMPFFLYVPLNAPHAPLQAPAPLIEKYAGIKDEQRRVFAAMVDAMDSAAGRILRAIDEEGAAANTVVLFFSDNGGPTNLGARNTPLRARKGTVWDGGLRVPAILRWSGRLPAGARSSQVATAMDVFPTLAGAAGVAARNTLPFDGRNLWDAIASNKPVAREDLDFTIESRDGFHFAVRRGEWKLVRHEPRPSGGAVNQLYRLDEDPQETKDVAAAHPALRDGEFSLM